MKEYETLVLMNKKYMENLEQKNIYVEFSKGDIVGMALELQRAKENVKSCLEGWTVDMHDIVYWAERVEKLRKEIKEMI